MCLQVLRWFSLSLGDWARLVPFGVAVGGLSYLSVQVSPHQSALGNRYILDKYLILQSTPCTGPG